MVRHILAISGGSFSEEENAYIDEYLLNIKNLHFKNEKLVAKISSYK